MRNTSYYISCLLFLFPLSLDAFAPFGLSTRETSILLVRSSTNNNVAPTILEKDEKKLPYEEESRRYRRTFYDSRADWIDHRSNERFLENLWKTYSSGLVRGLSKEIGTVFLISLGVCFYNDVFINGWQDFAGNMHNPINIIGNIRMPLAELPLTPFTLSSGSLGLLLVFRTNASYARWMEARTRWSACVNHSRNLVRLGAAWVNKDLPVETQRSLLKNLADCTWAYSRCLQRHFLGPQEDEAAFCMSVKDRLSPELADKLIEAHHKPIRAIYELTKAVNAFPLSDHLHVEMDVAVEHLSDVLGGCERIYSSPVPLVYTRHTERFLGFWILALPLSLYPSFEDSWNHVGLLPAAILIAFFFFGIEELAIQLEEPFSILPMEQLVNRIESSIDSTIQWHFEDLEAEQKAAAAAASDVVNGEKRRMVPFIGRKNNDEND